MTAASPPPDAMDVNISRRYAFTRIFNKGLLLLLLLLLPGADPALLYVGLAVPVSWPRRPRLHLPAASPAAA